MALTLNDAMLLSNNELVKGVVEEIIEKDETFAMLPFVRVNGKAYVYNRELTLAQVNFANPNDITNESASNFAQVTATLKILIGDVDVDKFLESTMSDTNDQKATQIALKAKQMGRTFKQTLVQGNATTSPTQFDGLRQLVVNAADPNMTIALNGALSLTALDQLADAVILGADAFIMRPGTIRAYRALLRLQYGTHAAMVEIPNFGIPVLSHNGIPILRNDWIPADETVGATPASGMSPSLTAAGGMAANTGNACSVYAIKFDEGQGVHALYGGDDAGIVVEDIGTVQNKDATRTRLKWYTSLALKSTRALGRLSGVTNI